MFWEMQYDVKKKNILETTTMDDKTEVKKIIENQIPFATITNFDGKEGEIVKTQDFLQCGVLFARADGFALLKKGKHNRPDKVLSE